MSTLLIRRRWRSRSRIVGNAEQQILHSPPPNLPQRAYRSWGPWYVRSPFIQNDSAAHYFWALVQKATVLPSPNQKHEKKIQ